MGSPGFEPGLTGNTKFTFIYVHRIMLSLPVIRHCPQQGAQRSKNKNSGARWDDQTTLRPQIRQIPDVNLCHILTAFGVALARAFSTRKA